MLFRRHLHQHLDQRYLLYFNKLNRDQLRLQCIGLVLDFNLILDTFIIQ